MIHDVDETLRAVLRRDVVNGTGVDISFEVPTKEWSARRNTPTLDLYLYSISEDLTRRQVQFEDIRNADGIVVERRMPPRKFKLSYMATAWTQRPEDEHRLLSSMLACFIRWDALPRELYQGSLAGLSDAIRCTVAHPLPPERSISDVWSALGGEMKPSLDIVVTAPFDTARYMETGPPVTEEPFVRIGPSDRSLESTIRRRHPAAEGDAPSEPEPVVLAETVEGGRTKVGRRFEVKGVPRP